MASSNVNSWRANCNRPNGAMLPIASNWPSGCSANSNNGIGQRLQELEQQSPGWRAALRKEMESLTDEYDGPLARSRWQRAEALMQEMDGNEQLSSWMQGLTLFKQRLSLAVGEEIHRRADSIEAAAHAEAATRNQHLQKLNAKINEKDNELANLDKNILARQTQLENESGKLGQAAEAVRLAREQLAGQLAGLNGLLQQSGPTLTLAAPMVLPLRSQAPDLEPPRLLGPAIEQHSDFVDSRLYPILVGLEPASKRSHADRLHRTLLSCPWVLVPSPCWSEAYGRAGRQRLGEPGLAVQSNWAGFTDVWSRELEGFWRQAASDLSRIYLLVFHEINRSLVQVWASAWLTLLDGHRPTLPADPPVHWPVNLRVLATVARDDAVFDLHESLLKRWAAPVDLDVSGGRTDPPAAPLVAGHVTATTWLRWAGRPGRPIAPGG